MARTKWQRERDELLEQLTSLKRTFVPVYPGSRIGYVIDPQRECWIWTGAVARNGYGRVGVPGDRRTVQAHVLYYARAGKVKRTRDLDHTCRRRYCVNPDHLELVSRSENSWRGAKAKLTRAAVAEIREAAARRTGSSVRAFAVPMAKKYGVREHTIRQVVMGIRWRDLP